MKPSERVSHPCPLNLLGAAVLSVCPPCPTYMVLGLVTAAGILCGRPRESVAQCDLEWGVKLVGSDAVPGDGFGYPVALSGNIAVVGAPLDDCDAGADCGSAYVFRFDGAVWVEEGKLAATDATPNDQFGSSLSVDGETVVVGVPNHTCPDGVACGSAYVFRFNGSAWVQEQELAASDAAALDFFGRSVSISEDVIVVGAHGDDHEPDLNWGAAYLYRFHPGGPGPWVEEAKFTPSSSATSAREFGWSVAVNGDTALVGAKGQECFPPPPPPERVGTCLWDVYVFRFNPITSGWDQPLKLIASDYVPWFGYSVALSGETALVGATAGPVRVYQLDPGATGMMVEQSQLTPWNDQGPVGTGSAMAIEGDTIVVGAAGGSCGTVTWCSAAYVFEFVGGVWVQQGGLTPSSGIVSGAFGGSVAVSGDKALVESRGVGSARVFTLAFPDCNLNGILDAADIAEGRSQDSDGSGIPDECETPPPGVLEWNQSVSDWITTRSLRFKVTAPVTATGATSANAIKVRMIDLQYPMPPNAPQFPPPDFSAFEWTACSAAGESVPPDAMGQGCCSRWVGPPGTFLESQDDASRGSYRAARLQCTPFYFDWITETANSPINVVGAEIAPSSTFSVQTYGSSCQGSEDTCLAVSAGMTMSTLRSGDITQPHDTWCACFQPDGLDVNAVVVKFKNLPGAAKKYVARIESNAPDPNTDVSALDIIACLEAFKGYAYPFSGPCPCPSTVPCNVTSCGTAADCTAAHGAGATCVRTCTDGPNQALACITPSHCGQCVGGTRVSYPCDADDDCPGGTCAPGTCGSGFCRDRCGRCD